MHSTSNTSSQQLIKNARSSKKKQLKKDYIRNWLKARNNTSEGSREKFTHKVEDYLKTIRNPAHRISMTKLRLGKKKRLITNVNLGKMISACVLISIIKLRL